MSIEKENAVSFTSPDNTTNNDSTVNDGPWFGGLSVVNEEEDTDQEQDSTIRKAQSEIVQTKSTQRDIAPKA